MRAINAGVAGLFVLALCACGGSGTSPEKVVNDVTTAVYNDDLNGMQTHFDAALQKQVTIDGATSFSQKLHQFGAYKGLAQTAADANGGRYDYTATFDNAAMAVHVRVDPDGRIAAYRIDVPQNVVARQ